MSHVSIYQLVLSRSLQSFVNYIRYENNVLLKNSVVMTLAKWPLWTVTMRRCAVERGLATG